MFMRYRGGGVGHLYMRAIEVWLAKTGWGSDDTLVPEDESNSIDSNQGSEDDGEDNTSVDGHSDEEASRSDGSTCTTDSEQEDCSDLDPGAENSSHEEDEETVEGELGFGCY